MNFVLIVLYFFCIYTTVHCNLYVDFLKDFIRTLKQPAFLTEYSCNFRDSVSLMKTLVGSEIPIEVAKAFPSEVRSEKTPHKSVLILNMACQQAVEVLSKAQELQLFHYPYRWVLFCETECTDSVKNLDISISSDISLCQVNGTGNVLVEKIFKYENKGNIISENWGNWSKQRHVTITQDEDHLFRRRSNFRGISLNACIVVTNNDTLNHLTDKREKHIDSITKVNYVLLHHLTDFVNVRLNISIQSTWGYRNNKSEWNGMIGELLRGEADIGGTPLFFTIDRVDIIDYIAMTTPTRSKFVFREPKLSYVTNVFMLPFDRYVWAAIVSLLVINVIWLYGILKWEWRKEDLQKKKDESSLPELRDRLDEIILFSFGALCQQGAASIPSSIPGRMTTIMMFISLMFLYTSYSANIVALLQSSSNSIQTLEDLLKSRLDIGVDDTVFNRFYFMSATEPTRRAIYLQKVAPPGKKDRFMPIEKGVRRIRDGLFAFHMETGPGYKLIGEIFEEGEKCGLKEIQYIQVIDPWLAIQKHSPYKEFLKIGLRKIQESGLQAREVGLIYTKRPHCITRGSNFISVGIVDCYPALVVLLGGVIASAVILSLEKFFFDRKKIYDKILHKKIVRPVISQRENVWPYLE